MRSDGVTNGSPEARFWSPCASIAKSIAFWSALDVRVGVVLEDGLDQLLALELERRLLPLGRRGGGLRRPRPPSRRSRPRLLRGLRRVPFAPSAFGVGSAGAVRLDGFAAGGERSTAASAATRREAFRAGRAAGTISAGRSARVRGATMVREV